MSIHVPLRRFRRAGVRRRLAALVAALAVCLGGLPVPAPVAAGAQAAAPIAVGGLTTNGRVDPLGIPGQNPVFGWMSTSSRRGVTQSAYEVQVGSSPGASDVWRPGRVASDRQVNVTYDGPALSSGTRYHWRVRVWDGQGSASAWSAPAWFETGLLSAGDWGSAAWIGKPAPSYENWTDYSATLSFKLTNTAFGTFLRAQNATNAYMWQINVGTTSSDIPRLVPHLRVNGNYSVLGAVDLRPFGFTRDALLKGTHTVTYTVSGTTIKTTLDDVVVDTRTMTNFGHGRVGVRTHGAESVTVSSFKVTKPDGTVLADPDFTANPFNGGSFSDRQVTVTGTTDAFLLGPDENGPLLRTGFRTDPGKTVKSARVYASAHGVYELSLNGRKVGDQFLAPGYTEYAKRIQSQTYDVTGLVREGGNGLGAKLGDGWWAGKIGLEGKGQYGHDLALVARLKITYGDGSVQWVDTGSDWRWAPGPFVATDNQLGETYAARFEQPGWDGAGFDASSWRPVAIRPSDTAKLSPQPDEPVRQTAVLDTVKVTRPSSGVTIYDLGQNMVGVPRVTLTGKAGETVRLRHAEVLNRDGTMYTANLRAALATDYYTFAKDGTITYQPTFTQHGFRYIEITGLSQAPEAADVKGVVWGSDLPSTGTLRTSNAMLNQLVSNVSWGARGNFLSIPTDTPARDERLGWTGDISIFAPTASYLSDMRAFLGKWMTDVRDEQKGNGSIPAVVPASNGVFEDSGVGWEDATITVPHALWRAYGDAQVVRDNYETMRKFFAYARASAGADNLETGRTTFFTADWLHLDDPSNQGVLGTAIWAQDVRMMAEMAQAVGRGDEAKEYADLYQAVRRSFTDAYVAQDGTVLGNSQAGYALALGMGLVTDPTRKQKAGQKYVAKLAQADNHLRTGFIGTPWLLPALTNIGRADLAYTLLLKEDYPSWGYEIRNGATTIWERWNSIQPDGSFGPVDMNSFNHYAYGAVADWMFQNIGGLSALAPGYKRSRIAPAIGGGLTQGSGRLTTVYGPLSSTWSTSDGDLDLKVTVPVNTIAEVHVPAKTRWAVTEGGRPATDAPGLRFLRMEGGAAVFEVGSGSYAFGVDPVLGGLGNGADAVKELSDLVAKFNAPGAPAAREWTRQAQASVSAARNAHVAGDEKDTARGVHRALARLGDLSRWTAFQVSKGHLSAADGKAVDALHSRIEADLSAVSGLVLGASATIEMPVGEWFPGSTIPVAIAVRNAGKRNLTSLAATLKAASGWQVSEAGDNPALVKPGETARLRYNVRVPKDAEPGPAQLEGTVGYDYRKGTAKLPVGASVAVAAPVVVTSVSLSPAKTGPGGVLTASIQLTNRTENAVTRSLGIQVPSGWTAPSRQSHEIAAKATVTVPVKIDVPLAVTQGDATIVAATGALPEERGTATTTVELVNPPANPVDSVDLGNATSETAHALTASASSGTNTEAGLTRRYTDNGASNGWFEVDLKVPAGRAFVIRAVETYNMAQLKTYDVTLDGHLQVQRRFQRTAGESGTVTYQFVVQPSADTADGQVRIRFQDVPGDFDPSIADIWSVPLN
ncbi:family 78 glycoside hydrolase catalytic domain [Actinomadura rudentiformis]|uniref:alpha-L-rhamnosidase n=1 Tax=Actinomadura rudentiformis TaxID=359158 RepID=A0A6H9Y870_9ACTN|nr:Bacterial alpha-L-rhamnosidase [Actinomadura rudentiformis]